MAKQNNIAQYTIEDLAAMRARGESGSNWSKAAAMTEAQLEASISGDVDETDMVIDWAHASIEMPEPKAVLNMRVDRHVLEFFKKSGKGYQTRINAVLKAFVEAQEHRPR